MDAEVVVLAPENEYYPVDRLSAWLHSSPPLYALGNPDLLRLQLTALFCSRKCPGDAILKAYDLACELREKQTPVISGFHTPVEWDMFAILLKGNGPMLWCPARGLEGMRLSPGIRQRIEQGHLLLLSCFAPTMKRMTRAMASQRNRLVFGLASDLQVVYASPGGEIEKLIRAINQEDHLVTE